MAKLLTAKTVRSILLDLLANTNSPSRINRIERHLEEIEEAVQSKEKIEYTRIGSIIHSFITLNKDQVIDKGILYDFLYTRLINTGPGRAAYDNLVSLDLIFEASDIGRILTK